jgi:hypothetical protein
MPLSEAVDAARDPRRYPLSYRPMAMSTGQQFRFGMLAFSFHNHTDCNIKFDVLSMTKGKFLDHRHHFCGIL